MASDPPTWRDRYPEEVTCVRCLEVYDVMHLDRLLWCEECRRDARNRAGWWGWLGGVLFGAAIALYIWLGVGATRMLLGAWIGTVAAAIWLGQKVAREFAYGVMRFRNRRAVEAKPPDAPPTDHPA
ncbi:MAG: hypothetical protein U5R14_12980 [Gemmatimonadota bacterium]|nr:hypothetical protein [Gemmatimonadota bacterium]